MSHKDEYLKYTIYLTDLVFFDQRSAAPPLGEPQPIQQAPKTAAARYALALGVPFPIQADPSDPFLAPCVRSTWFGSTANSKEAFPLDQDTFTRTSGGWFGIGFLFGTKTTYHWVGSFELAPKVGVGVGAGVVQVPMPRRRWIDGAELPGQGEGGSGNAKLKVSRRASRHLQGYGYQFDNTTVTITHSHTENGAAADKRAWERLYIRVLKYPDTPGGPPPVVASRIWRCTNTLGSAGALIACTPAGNLILCGFDGITTAIVRMTGQVAPVNGWLKLDVVYLYGDTGSLLGSPPNNGVKVYLNGTKIFDYTWGPGTGGLFDAAANVSQSIVGGGSIAGVADGFIWQLDDWVCSDYPAATYEIGGTADFPVGSRVAMIGATGFAADHNPAWVGDWRLTKQRPVTTSTTEKLTSATSGARMAVNTDAAVEIDGCADTLGLVAIDVGLYSDKGGGGADGTLGWMIQGVEALASVVQNFGAYAWNNVLYRPTLLNPISPATDLKLIHVKGASADAAKVQALMAVAELLGVFGKEDQYPITLGTPPGLIALQAGIHNAPYPHTPWGKIGAAPISPNALFAGTYVGNGVGQDLKFQTPIHLLWIRPLAGSTGGVQWWSSMNAPHIGGTRQYEPDAIPEICIDPLFVPGQPSTDNALPTPPDTLEQAVALANQLAYGFHKNDISYPGWAPYLTDKVYFFGRLLGSGNAGGPDQAVAGLYAVPPSNWLSTQQQQTLVRLAGAGANWNANGVTYQYIALSDPGMRFIDCGALGPTEATVALLSKLDSEKFTPEAALVFQEQNGASSTQSLFFKGLGSAAAAITNLTVGEIAAALTFALGNLGYQPGMGLAGANQIPYLAMRRNDGSGDPGASAVLQLATWIGDGAGARIIPLLNSCGKRPVFGLVVGHNGIAKYRDPSHAGTNSTTFPSTNDATDGIQGGGIDSITVGVNCNALGVIYDAFVLPGGALPCNNGWGCNGTYFPTDPSSPAPGPWDPPPPNAPTGTPVPVADPNFPPGGGPNDFGPQCVAGSTLIINQALSRIGMTKQVGDIVNEKSQEATVARLHYSDDVDQTLRDFPWPFATRYATLALLVGPVPVASPDWIYSYRRPADCVFERRLVVPREGALDPTPPPFQLGSDDDVLSTPPIIAIVGNTATSPTVFQTTTPHGYAPAQIVIISSVVGSIPFIGGPYPVLAVIDSLHFSININVTVPGVGGFVGAQPVVTSAGGGLVYTNQPGAVLEYTCRPPCAALRGDPLFRDALAWRHAVSLAPALTRMTDMAVNAQKMYWAAIELARSVLRPGNPGRVIPVATFDVSLAAQAANVAVVNRGLIRIGAQMIRNLLTDQSRSAQAARNLFEDELECVLRDFPWAFATAYQDPLLLVAGTAAAPVNKDWLFAYRTPANMLLARRLVRAGTGRRYDPVPATFRLGADATGPLLFTNEVGAILEYTVRVEAVVLMADAIFRDALAWRLAASLAPSIAFSDPEAIEQLGRGADDPQRPKEGRAALLQLRQKMALTAWQMYARTLSLATTSNAVEQQQEPDGQADWISARESGPFPGRDPFDPWSRN